MYDTRTGKDEEMYLYGRMYFSLTQAVSILYCLACLLGLVISISFKRHKGWVQSCIFPAFFIFAASVSFFLFSLLALSVSYFWFVTAVGLFFALETALASTAGAILWTGAKHSEFLSHHRLLSVLTPCSHFMGLLSLTLLLSYIGDTEIYLSSKIIMSKYPGGGIECLVAVTATIECIYGISIIASSFRLMAQKQYRKMPENLQWVVLAGALGTTALAMSFAAMSFSFLLWNLGTAIFFAIITLIIHAIILCVLLYAYAQRDDDLSFRKKWLRLGTTIANALFISVNVVAILALAIY